VLPVLEYSCEIWGVRDYDVLEKIQLKFLKMLLSVKSSTCTYAVLGDLGRFPLAIRSKICIVKFWIRLQRLENSSIAKRIFNMLNNLNNLGFNNWVSQVHKILYDHNMDMYLDENFSFDDYNEVLCINALKDKMYTNYINEWKNNITTKPVLRTYVKFKLDFYMEPYLLYIKDNRIRKVISQFRLSSHDFAVEKGRHSKPKVPLDQRICRRCGSGIEDELHVLTICSFYSEERNVFKNKLIESNFNMVNDHQDFFISVISSNNEKVLFILGKFLLKVQAKRNTF
jgi:hypothetical protein